MSQLTVEKMLHAAVELHQAGRLSEAENLYRQILTQQPDHADAMHLLGVVAHQVGRNDISVNLICGALSLRAHWPEAQSNLGNALRADGKLDEAIVAYRSAIELNPGFAEAHNNLGNALRDKRQFSEALAAFQAALAQMPGYAEASNNLGNVLRETGRINESITAYRHAIVCMPSYADAHNNLGIALGDNGQLEEALTSIHQAIAINPSNASVHSNLGNVLKNKGELDQAIAAYRQSVAILPGYAEAHSNLGEALRSKGLLDEAIDACSKAILLNPRLPEAQNNLGNVLRNQGKYEQSIAAYRQAVTLRSDYAEAFCNLGNALRDFGNIDEAVAAFEYAISVKPGYSNAHNSLGNGLKDKGQWREAVAAYQQAIALEPENAANLSNLLLALNYLPDCNSREIAAELSRWNKKHAQPLAKLIKPYLNTRDGQRPLRIGYVSPDFCSHVVGRNIFPLFMHHDHQQFEIFVYAQVLNPDAMTSEFQKRTDAWRNIMGLSDDQVARQIRGDQIDILVDLALHTSGNRLLVFARKPAPVQVTFAGYPGSTGLTAIDYRLSDPYLDPIGIDETIYAEKTVLLADSFWCYDPLQFSDMPVNALPALNSGVVTFGCLNNFCKVNDQVLALWARVLRQVKNSCLILLSPEGVHRARILDYFRAEQIDPQRIGWVAQQSHRHYLETYHRIDMGLDTFPYNGHTTSLDSLWMGVPVVTLIGTCAVARAGWCQLSNLGLQELAAHMPEDFVRIASELADDLPRLSHLRSTLRQRMQKSPLMDAVKFTRSIEAAYRQMGEKWRAI